MARSGRTAQARGPRGGARFRRHLQALTGTAASPGPYPGPVSPVPVLAAVWAVSVRPGVLADG